MSEALDPIETGRHLHEHGEKNAHSDDEEPLAKSPHARIVQIGEVILLAVVTLTAAWAGFSAARWATASRIDIAKSSTLRNLATRDDLTAISLRNFDSSTFNAWFTAWTLGDRQKEIVAERRFRPEFRVAFNAWMATNPLHNPHAPPGPTYMPEYKVAAQAKANALDTAADEKFNAGTRDGSVSDNFVQVTVLLAAVLFLVGIGSSFKLHSVRYALIAVGSGLLVVSIVLILHEPALH